VCFELNINLSIKKYSFIYLIANGVLSLLAIAARFDVQYCIVVVKLRKVSVIKKYFLVT